MRGFSLLGEFIIGGSTVFRNVGVVSQHALTAVGCVIVTSWTFCTCLKIVKAIRSGILVIVSCIPRIPHLLSECVSVTGEWGDSAYHQNHPTDASVMLMKLPKHGLSIMHYTVEPR